MEHNLVSKLRIVEVSNIAKKYIICQLKWMSNISLFRDCSEIVWWKSLELCKCYLKYTGIRELDVIMIL